MDYDLLEFRDERGFLDGNPFSGVAYEKNSAGVVVSEIEFADGYAEGMTRRYFPDGKVQSEYFCRRNLHHGKYRSWFPSGAAHVSAEYELGVELVSVEFDESGNQIEKRELKQDSFQAKILERNRRLIYKT